MFVAAIFNLHYFFEKLFKAARCLVVVRRDFLPRIIGEGIIVDLSRSEQSRRVRLVLTKGPWSPDKTATHLYSYLERCGSTTLAGPGGSAARASFPSNRIVPIVHGQGK